MTAEDHLSYKDAGNIDAGNALSSAFKPGTTRPEVLGGLGDSARC
jgi:hypothetical protein